MTYRYLRASIDGAWLTVQWRLAEHRVFGYRRCKMSDFAEMAKLCSMITDADTSVVGVREFDDAKVHDAYRVAEKWIRDHRHTHTAGDGDKCMVCGLDLRHEIHHRDTPRCPACAGIGRLPFATDSEPCGECGGSGKPFEPVTTEKRSDHCETVREEFL